MTCTVGLIKVTAIFRGLAMRVCRAWHVTASVRVRCPGFVEPKGRETARASPRGGVWRKSNPKLRGDEQEPDMRRGTSRTSGHVTAKSDIYEWCDVLCKSGVYAAKETCLTAGDLSGASGY